MRRGHDRRNPTPAALAFRLVPCTCDPKPSASSVEAHGVLAHSPTRCQARAAFYRVLNERLGLRAMGRLR